MLDYVQCLWTLLTVRVHAAVGDDENDRGASALEWAIIAGVSVVLATLIGGIVYHIVSTNSTKLSNCGDTPVGDNTKC